MFVHRRQIPLLREIGTAALVLSLGAAAGCGGGSNGAPRKADSSHSVQRVSANCPVTIPHNATGVLESGSLRTILPTTGLIVASRYAAAAPQGAFVADLRPDGSIDVKFPWWRAAGITAPLRITGETVPPSDATARGSVDRTRRAGFRPSTVSFPRAGCWRVTGRAGRARLSFVVFVVD